MVKPISAHLKSKSPFRHYGGSGMRNLNGSELALMFEAIQLMDMLFHHYSSLVCLVHTVDFSRYTWQILLH
jgi:hypothetical protein